jgi:hypothetical protein
MTTITINLPYDRFDCPVAKSKTTTFGKRGLTGAVEVLFSSIPERVLASLLIEAITARMHKEADKLDKAKATEEEVKAALSGALQTLQAGTTGKATVKDNSREKAKTLLKGALRKSVIARTGAKPNEEDVKRDVTNLFKDHTAYKKAKTPEDKAKFEAPYRLVERFIATAKAQIAEDESLMSTLVTATGGGEVVNTRSPPKPKATKKPAAQPQA